MTKKVTPAKVVVFQLNPAEDAPTILRFLTAAAVSPQAMVVPGAVNEIIRLQTKEGYAYFQH